MGCKCYKGRCWAFLYHPLILKRLQLFSFFFFLKSKHKETQKWRYRGPFLSSVRPWADWQCTRALGSRKSDRCSMCLTLWDPMDCGPSGSSVHRILQTRILERADILFSAHIAGGFFTIWATFSEIWSWKTLTESLSPPVPKSSPSVIKETPQQ